MRISSLVAGLTMLFAVGCSEPAPPCPSDQQLLAQFKAQTTQFDALAANADDGNAKAALGIVSVVKRSTKPARIWFPVWYHDFPGPGGCYKGYAYCEEKPATLVGDIDAKTDPGGPGTVEVYRAIKDNWYLFYQSSD